MTLESKQLLNDEIITGAAILGAGRTLGLTDDETIDAKRATLRRDQRKKYEQRSRREANLDIMRDDERLAEIDAYEREFQRDKPIRAADLLAMGEYGMDEADLQQVTSGRIGNVKQVDSAGGSDGNRDERKFRSARRDVLPQKIGAWVQTPGGKSIYVAGENAPNQRVSPELREATILQELGLASPPREEVPYQVNKKTGQKRRNFGRVVKDEDGQIVKEVLNRVKRQRQAGQTASEDDIISRGKYPTAKRGSYRGIGEDGPQGIQRPVNAPSSALADAYQRLRSQVETGQVSVDALVEYPAGANGGSTARTVGEVLTRMEESLGGKAELGMLKTRASDLVIQDQRSLRDRARKQLRQFAVQAAAEGNPLSKTEAYALLERLQDPKAVTDIKVAREALGNIRSQGSTREVIGENVMSDEAWKNTATKQIPQLPIMAKADTISNAQVSQMVNADGVVVGHAAGGRFLGETNTPDTLQNLNVPSNQQNLISFISENLQYDNKGGLKPVVITEATEAFTDAASKLKGFGSGVRNIPTGIHSLSEAQFMMDRLIERRQNEGGTFSRYNSENPGKPLKVPAGETPTVNDLMSTMRVDKATQGRLASALYQMALAEGSDVNQAGKQRYADREGSYAPVYRRDDNRGSVNLDLRKEGIHAVDLPRQNITFDSPAGFFYDGADAAYIPNSQRANIDGKSVYLQAALRGLDDPGAREPFIGQVAGEPAPKLRYRKGFGPGVSLEEGYSDLERSMVKGKRGYSQKRVDANVALARGVEARQRASEERAYYDEMRKAANSLGADIELEAERRQDNRREARSRDKLLKSIASGQPLPGRASGDDGFRVASTPFRPARTTDPRAAFGMEPKGQIAVNSQDPMIDSQFRQAQQIARLQGVTSAPVENRGDRRPIQGPSREPISLSLRTQPTRPAPVVPTIAPTPGAPTGSQVQPAIDSGRGGALVSLRQPERQSSPASSYYDGGDARYDVATRFDTDGFRASAQQGDSEPGKYTQKTINRVKEAAGNQVSQWGDNLKAFATKDKYKVGRRALYGGGAAAVLGTILNMGNNKEEEEEMVR